MAAVCSVMTCEAGPSPTPSVATQVRFQQPLPSATYGEAVTVKAQLREAATGTGLAGHPVSWCHTVPGGSVCPQSVSTAANGWAQLRFASKVSTLVYISYAGEQGFANTSWTHVTILVTPAVTARIGRGSLAVAVQPAGRHAYQLQRWNGKAWVGLAAGTGSLRIR